MKTLLSLSLVAALSLANAVYAQTQTPPNQTESQRGSQTKTDITAPSAASGPHQRSVTTTTATESPTSGSTEPSAASSQHQRDAMPATQTADARMSGSNKTDKHGAKMVGTKVQMSTGESLGEVKEVLLDTQGNSSYAVISHGGVMGMGAKRTAVPWATVKAAMQHDKLIMDRSQLEQAPVLPSGKTPDASIGTWSRDADMYWRAKVSTRSTSLATGSDGNTSPSNTSPAPVKQYN